MTITPQALHEALQDIASETAQQRIERLFTDSPDRADRYRCEGAGLTLDFSKHLLTDDALQTLLELATVRSLPEAFKRLIQGGRSTARSADQPAQSASRYGYRRPCRARERRRYNVVSNGDTR